MPLEQVAEADAPLAYDIVTAARKVGVGRSTIFDEINSGALIARKVGRRTLIRHDDLVAWTAALPARVIATRKRAA